MSSVAALYPFGFGLLLKAGSESAAETFPRVAAARDNWLLSLKKLFVGAVGASSCPCHSSPSSADDTWASFEDLAKIAKSDDGAFGGCCVGLLGLSFIVGSLVGTQEDNESRLVWSGGVGGGSSGGAGVGNWGG